MAETTSILLQKIASSEDKVKQLIDQRNKELFNIIVKYNAITIDNSALLGFFIFALNPANENDSILKKFKELAKAANLPSKLKNQYNNKTDKNTN